MSDDQATTIDEVERIICRSCSRLLGMVASICSGGPVVGTRFECTCGSTLESTFHPDGFPR